MGGTDHFLLRKRRADPHSARILAFQPECNPPAHTAAASRAPATANTSPHPPSRKRGTARHYSRRRWRTSWGRPGGAWRPQRTLLPIPLPEGRGTSSTTLRATPPAQPLLARVTRCGHPRIGTRHNPATPPAAARDSSVHDHAGHWGRQPTTTNTASESGLGTRQLKSGQ